MPTRDEALALLEEWVSRSRGCATTCAAVEAAVRHYARMRGGDEELWGLAGCCTISTGRSILTSTRCARSRSSAPRVLREPVLHAILAHRSDFTGVEPETELDRVLVACDELTGLITATVLVRPTASATWRRSRCARR
jgi:predicted hydrolase (HD superfamily)